MMSTRTRWLGGAGIGLIVLAIAAVALGSTDPRARSAGAQVVQGAHNASGASAGAGGVALEPMALMAPAGAPQVARAGVNAPAAADSGTGVTGDGLTDRVIRTADISVRVDEGRFEPGWNAVFRIATQFGGRVMSSSRGAPQPVASADAEKAPAFGDISIRVPASSFERAVAALRGIGDVLSEGSSAQDVTQEYVDLASRLRNLRAERAALLVMFDRARTIKDTLAVQNRLSDVQGQIEEASGRQKYLDEHTAYSTVNLHLAEPGAVIETATFGGGPSFSQAWDTAMTGLVRIAGASLIVAVWLAPFAALALLALALRRRMHREQPGTGQA